MIIATIGHYHYKLKDITAAEQLLKILDEAIPADDNYLPKRGFFYTRSEAANEIRLAIIQGDLLTDEELKKLQATATI